MSSNNLLSFLVTPSSQRLPLTQRTVRLSQKERRLVLSMKNVVGVRVLQVENVIGVVLLVENVVGVRVLTVKNDVGVRVLLEENMSV